MAVMAQVLWEAVTQQLLKMVSSLVVVEVELLGHMRLQ